MKWCVHILWWCIAVGLSHNNSIINKERARGKISLTFDVLNTASFQVYSCHCGRDFLHGPACASHRRTCLLPSQPLLVSDAGGHTHDLHFNETQQSVNRYNETEKQQRTSKKGPVHTQDAKQPHIPLQTPPRIRLHLDGKTMLPVATIAHYHQGQQCNRGTPLQRPVRASPSVYNVRAHKAATMLGQQNNEDKLIAAGFTDKEISQLRACDAMSASLSF